MARENDEIEDIDLDMINGGTFTRKARKWINRNKDEVYSRAGWLFSGALDDALDKADNADKEYDVPAIKKALRKHGLNVDDLD